MIMECGTPDKAGILRIFKDVLVHNTLYQELKQNKMVAAVRIITVGMDQNTRTRYLLQTAQTGNKALATVAGSVLDMVLPEDLQLYLHSAVPKKYEDYYARVQEAVRRKFNPSFHFNHFRIKNDWFLVLCLVF